MRGAVPGPVLKEADMSTRIGFYVFAGLVLGTIIGKWLPFIASIEALAGGIIGAILGVIIDRLNRKKQD